MSMNWGSMDRKPIGWRGLAEVAGLVAASWLVLGGVIWGMVAALRAIDGIVRAVF